MSEKLFNVGIKSIIMRDDKVLIVKNAKGFWEVPGGRMDGDETIEQTLERELKEELPNVAQIKVHGIVGAVRVHKDIKENVSLVLIFYRVSADFDGQPTLSHEHTEYKWATKEQAKQLVYDKYVESIENAFLA